MRRIGLPRLATRQVIDPLVKPKRTMSIPSSSDTVPEQVEQPSRAFPRGPKIVPPEGMSKRAYKRQLKAERIEKQRPQWLAERKQKRRDLKERRKAEGVLAVSNRKRVPSDQQMTSTSVVIDCDFDEYMKEGERTSLARQIMSCYSENRKARYQVDLQVTSFNKLLEQRFVQNMKNTHLNWKNIRFQTEDLEPAPNMVYLSSDSDTVLESLLDNTTYIVGGIVDKGRYKNLCNNKAKRLGLRTARLPIDEFIKLSGRRVLTTNHVFELLVKWLEVRDWKRAFEMVLPDRKMKQNPKTLAIESEHEADNEKSERDERSEMSWDEVGE